MPRSGSRDELAAAPAPARPPAPRHERPLREDEKRIVTLLGLPTMALALAVTVVSTYLPVVASDAGGSTLVIGLIIGVEGVIALWLPLVVGTWSDRLVTPLGGRVPFLLVATPFVVIGLAAMGVISTVGMMAVAAFVFFLGYFLAYEPYRALYPDAVGPDVAGRAQGVQALWRGAGTGLALLGGGLLLALGQAVPFLVCAAVYVAATIVFVQAMLRDGIPDHHRPGRGGLRAEADHVLGLIRGNVALKAFLLANALWELSLGALKTFVVLYVTKGLGYSQAASALIIGGVSLIVLVAAVVSGRMADRHGIPAVFSVCLPVYGIALLVPFLVTVPWIVALAVPFVAIGGGAIMALPYALMMPLMPPSDHGTLTGYYSFSRGLGAWLGPLLGGVAITAFAGVFTSTHGYQAVWGVCALAVFVSMWPLGAVYRGITAAAAQAETAT
jgi:MFS family permease